MPGITLYLQPVQDLTIEDRVSRTQFQFTWRIRTRTVSSEWVPKLVERLQQAPELADVASDLQDRGLQAFLDIDRDAASRLGISVAAIDDALYDAFGQRLISTIYTQANQYRVVLEAAPRFQIGPEALGQITSSSSAHRAERQRARSPASSEQQVPLSSIARVEQRHPAGDQPCRPVPGRDDVVQPRARRVAGRARSRRSSGAARDRHAGQHPDALPGRGRRRSARRSTARCC